MLSENLREGSELIHDKACRFLPVTESVGGVAWPGWCGLGLRLFRPLPSAISRGRRQGRSQVTKGQTADTDGWMDVSS